MRLSTIVEARGTECAQYHTRPSRMGSPSSRILYASLLAFQSVLVRTRNKIRGKLAPPPPPERAILELFCFLGQLLFSFRETLTVARRDAVAILHANRITFTLNPAAVRTRAPRNKSGLHLPPPPPYWAIIECTIPRIARTHTHTHTQICCQNWKKTHRSFPLNWTSSSSA